MVASEGNSYVGSELDLFSEVVNWKKYWAGKLQPYIRGDVLEVGAGIGANTRMLGTGRGSVWTCLEPDSSLCERIRENLVGGVGDPGESRIFNVLCGTLSDISKKDFDTIIYIDVLEHIRADRDELEKASFHLRPGGTLIVLSPAHNFLFSPFDAAIGHLRRYNRRSLLALSPASMSVESAFYLDSAGLLLSLGNRMLLRQSLPKKSQLLFWDRWFVPISRLLDGLLGHSVGKTIVVIWKKN